MADETEGVEQIQHSDGSWRQLDERTAIHVLRNPAGWTEEAVRACRLFAADILDRDYIRRNPPRIVSQ